MPETPIPHIVGEESYQQVLDTARRLLLQSQMLSGRLHHMQRVVTALNSAVTHDQVLDAVVAHVRWLFKFDHCSICLQHTPGEWELRTLMGNMSANRDGIMPALSINVPADVEDLTDHLLTVLAGFTSYMIIPLESEDETLGTLNFASHAADPFGLEDRRTANLLAAQITNGLRNVRLLEETQRARQESQQYLAQLEAGSSEVDEFSYAVAHDLKSPLHVLHGYISLLQLLLVDYDNPEVQTYLKEVDTASRNMAHIIDQLLWLAQLSNAQAVAVPVDMSGVARRSLWRFTPELKRRRVTINIAPDMPEALGQEGWVEEIFANLIGNAIKYSGEDNPHPQIVVSGDLSAGMARYEVTDNGIGIALPDQKRIFELFTRLRLVGADGHGLGLSIVSRIVQKLGGQIGVRSAAGVGSTFWFTLPAAKPTE